MTIKTYFYNAGANFLKADVCLNSQHITSLSIVKFTGNQYTIQSNDGYIVFPYMFGDPELALIVRDQLAYKLWGKFDIQSEFPEYFI